MDMDFNISDKITENIKCIREHVGKSCWSLSDRLRFCLNTSAGNDSFPNCDGEHPDYINQRYIEILTDRENCSDDYVAAYQMCALHYLAQKNQTKGPLQGPASYFCEILTDRTCRPPSKKLRENMEFNSDETDHSVTSDDSGSSNSPSEWQSKMLSYHLKISEFIRCVRKRKLFPCRSVHEKASECTDVSELKENLPACNSNRFGLQFYAILQDGTCQEDYVAAYYICLMERTKEEYGLASLFCSILEDKTCRNITKRSSGGLLQVPSISIHSACLLSLILVCILRGY
ncbi:uncharacterized protein LOC122807972 [Protopterus annectens]|uniref:uncharacterized protein LOC122807972 n=1 Tax=Protopterus annectens TaxID=7888 RepID=UPI001CFBBDFF|nr:uncharacterized protein LOC122807972 [Protopterus annectens]